MSAQLSLDIPLPAPRPAPHTRPPQDRRPHHNGRGKKHTGAELGFMAAEGVQWTRTRPTVPGVYPVVGRCGGVWLGDTRRADADWRGWWCSMTVGEARNLVRPMPPAPEW